MKLIATRDFFRVPALKNIKVEGGPPIHQNQIHKGARFEIGEGAKLSDLTEQEKQLVGLLSYANCIGDATNAEVLKSVGDDIATDKKREANVAKLARDA